MSGWRPAFMGVIVLAAALAIAVAFVRGSAAPQTLDDRVHAVAATIRCPVCLNLSVADSPSPVAQEMRTQIRQELQAGSTPDQVRARFVAAYGQWILLAPPKQGLTWLAWLLPPLVVTGSGVAAALVIRRWTLRSRQLAQPMPAVSEEERRLLAAELARAHDEEPLS